MPDLLNLSITALGASNVNVPRAQIAATVVDTADQSVVIADFTGANAIAFPAVIGTLTAEQRATLIRHIATWLVLVRAGLDPGTDRP